MEPLAFRKMGFEEFCAAAISTHQLEALDGWERIASTAFEYFEREGNRSISVDELARVCAVMDFGTTFLVLLILFCMCAYLCHNFVAFYCRN